MTQPVYNARATKESHGWVTNGSLYYSLLDENDVPYDGYKSWGYVSAIQMVLATQQQDLTIYNYSIGDVADTIFTNRTATMTITLTDAQAANLKNVLMGTKTVIPASVSDETINVKCYVGVNNPFNRMVDSYTTVKSEDGTKTYDSKNLIVTQSSILILSEQEQEANGATNVIELALDANGRQIPVILKLTAKFKQQNKVEGFTQDQIKISMYFEGRSVAKGNTQPILVFIHKAVIQPGTFDVLSPAQFGNFQITVNCLASDAIEGGDDVSKFFTVSTSRT